MKKILLLLCIFSITFTAKAQLFRKTWENGSYTDTAGHKFSGLIFYALPEASVFKGKGDRLFFKINKDAAQQKIPSTLIRSFVISTDSFTVSHHPSLEKFPFLQVVIDHETKLYYSAITQSSIPVIGGGLVGGAIGAVALSGKGGSAYYFGPDENHLTTLVHKNYIEVMSKLMADKPEVVERIRHKKFPSKSTANLITYYHTGILPKEAIDDVY